LFIVFKLKVLNITHYWNISYTSKDTEYLFRFLIMELVSRTMNIPYKKLVEKFDLGKNVFRRSGTDYLA